jgi:hypothetical protein
MIFSHFKVSFIRTGTSSRFIKDPELSEKQKPEERVPDQWKTDVFVCCF